MKSAITNYNQLQCSMFLKLEKLNHSLKNTLFQIFLHISQLLSWKDN